MEDLQGMRPEERTALLHALSELSREDPLEDPVNLRRRQIVMILILGCCAWLIPWTFFLAFELPRHHTAELWSVTWAGFDVALLMTLTATLLAIWRRLQVAIIGVIITGTLLTCDAWFDVLLSWGSKEFALSVATALLGELPLAGLCFFAARRLVRLTVHAVWARGGFGDGEPPLIHLRLFTLSAPDRRGETAGGAQVPSQGRPNAR
ncbi:hypothetical protein ACRYCC_34340 [Actinomadura scrupuli]|uniref:hypothetical protein n=1 Tax=Actinomadura scrupuli TaxID=559629 RepID=UPI003D9739EA